jgi:hypothetical protein
MTDINEVDLVTSILRDKNAQKITRRAERTKAPAFYPSSASVRKDGMVFGACARASYYSFINAPRKEMSETSLWAIWLGEIIHENVQTLCKERLGGRVEIEKETEKDYGLSMPVRGRLDMYFPDMNTATEIKTCYGAALKGEDSVKIKPKLSHLFQSMLYVDMLGLSSIGVLYLARDSAYRTLHTIIPGTIHYGFSAKYKDSSLKGKVYAITIEDIIDGYRYVDHYIAKKEVPPRDFAMFKDWNCSYCDFSNLCYPEKPALAS